MKLKKKIRKFMKNPRVYTITKVESKTAGAIPILIHGEVENIVRVLYADIRVNVNGDVKKFEGRDISEGKLELHYGGDDCIVLNLGSDNLMYFGFERNKGKFAALIITEMVVACWILYDGAFMAGPMIVFVQGHDRIDILHDAHERIMELGFLDGIPTIPEEQKKLGEEVTLHGEKEGSVN